MYQFSRFALAAIFICLVTLTAARADTIIPGGEIQDSVWPASGSPYRVQGTITLPEDGFLTIEPGVEVLFEGNYQFVIEGRLVASGTGVDSILFTATNSLEGWGGLRFLNAQVYSRLDYCRFELGWAQGNWPENCGGAIYLYGSIQAITHCSFVNNRAVYNGGAIFLWGGAPEFAYNLFTDNLSSNGQGHALYLGDCDGLVLNHLTVANNGSGSGYSLFMANDGSNFVMTNSILWDSFRFFSFVPGSITYNCIDPSPPSLLTEDSLLVFGAGNLGADDFDPFFLDPENGDLRVQEYSQTIDAASLSSPYSAEPEPNGGRANQGAYGNSSKATISLPLLSFAPNVRNLEAPSFDFGSQKILTTALVDTFSLYNVGRIPLILDSLLFTNSQFSGTLFSIIDPVYGEVVVLPDTSVLCSLLFLPTAIDSVEGSMSLLDNDTTSNPLIDLSGVGVYPVIELIPDTLHFPLTNVGESSDTLWLGIMNAGENQGGIESDLYLYTFPSTVNFVINNPDTSGNPTQILDTIKVDSTKYYPVFFTPTDRLDFAENVTVSSRNAGSALLHATGTGSQPVLLKDSLYYAQDSLFFSVITLGQDSTQEIILKNVGPIDLTIYRPTLV
ncbi:MAG TPA: right-handed parallel beta-helix repeat-containing protein, partial [bacterium]